jgi:hypothetical protein
MSANSVNELLRYYGFPALRPFSGLPKNVRKRRNSWIGSAARRSGSLGISALLNSEAYKVYTDPKRFGKKELNAAPSEVSHLPGFSQATGPCGGWGKLPNVSSIDYAEDDPRGWTYVDGKKRSRKCMILDESDE